MKVDVYFDYACPYCYLGLAELEQVMPDFPEIELVWRAAEAHPRPEPNAVVSYDPIPNWFIRLQERCKAAGILLNPSYSPTPHSDLAFQGMHFIREIDGGDLVAYHKNIYRAMFVEGKNLEDINVLCECAKPVVKDVEAFYQAIQEGMYFQTQRDCNDIAWTELGLQAIPTLICDDKKLESLPGIGLQKEDIRTFLSSLS